MSQMQCEWDVARQAPSEPLRRYVRGDYTGYTERTNGPLRRREFPGPFVVTVFEFGPPIRTLDRGDQRRVASYRGGFVAGLSDAFAVCEHDGFQQGIQVNLSPIGARLLFGVPMSELSGRILSVRDLLPPEHRGSIEHMHNLERWSDRFDLLDQMLIRLLNKAKAGARTDVIAWAVRRIEQTSGDLNIRRLADDLGYSRKHVISMFRDQVGIPPKQFAQIVRFDRLLQHLRRRGDGNWAELAQEFGYYDQAHLAREVRHFSGGTPADLRLAAAATYELLTTA